MNTDIKNISDDVTDIENDTTDDENVDDDDYADDAGGVDADDAGGVDESEDGSEDGSESGSENDIDDAVVEDDKKNYIEVVTVHRKDRQTSDIMTQYEFSEIIGIRASQIERGGHIFTDATGITDARMAAIKELFDRRCPLKVIRKINDYAQEEWSANEMGFSTHIRPNF